MQRKLYPMYLLIEMYKLRLPYKLDEINMIGCFDVVFLFREKEHLKTRLVFIKMKIWARKFVMKLTVCVDLFWNKLRHNETQFQTPYPGGSSGWSVSKKQTTRNEKVFSTLKAARVGATLKMCNLHTLKAARGGDSMKI